MADASLEALAGAGRCSVATRHHAAAVYGETPIAAADDLFVTTEGEVKDGEGQADVEENGRLSPFLIQDSLTTTVPISG